MKNAPHVYVFVGIFLLLAGCNIFRYRSADPFYSYTGEWDSIRFPLLKPYEAVSIVGGDGWSISLPYVPNDGLFYASVQQAQKIAVANNVIMVYTPYEPGFSLEMRDWIAYWFLLIPSMNIQTGFNNEDDFLINIQEYDIDEVNWENPDALYQRFAETGCLEWIPGCQ